MRLAAVLQQDGETVAKLAEGPRIVVWDSSNGSTSVMENPGFTAAAGRRMAALKAMLVAGVEAVCTPPQGFCPHSYREAVRRSVRFIVVDPGTRLRTLQEQGESLAARAVTALPPELLAEPHHHAHGEAHPHA